MLQSFVMVIIINVNFIVDNNVIIIFLKILHQQNHLKS